MNVTPTGLEGLLIVSPVVRQDERGYFLETWTHSRYAAHGMPMDMGQDNLSWSRRGVLRGLHYQFPRAQAKLVSVAVGEIFDVAVDIRVGSPTFGRWRGVWLSAENHRQLYVPEGFAHGFCVLSEGALVSYKCSREYDPAGEGAILWSDPDLGIDWPIAAPLLSPKDAAALPLSATAPEQLPRMESR